MYVVQSASTFKIKIFFSMCMLGYIIMWLHNFRELLTALFKTILCILLNEVQAIAGRICESKLPLGKEVQ